MNTLQHYDRIGLSKRTYVILVTVMAVLITALEILDGTIVSVALNTMRGSLGATIDQMSWTMTAYITASAMSIPLTGFLSKRLGRRRLMLIAITAFALASVLCGFSTNLFEIVALRFIQGAVGALLGPLSQGLLADNFSKEDMGRAMAFYGMGLMTAPILGPIIGAVVTNSLGWRWDFFINVPVCLIGLIGVYFLVPKQKRNTEQAIDWTGMFWLVLSAGGIEYVLNEGNSLGWFGSHEIIIIAVITAFSSITFFIHGYLKQSNNIINLKLYKDRNFATSSLLIFLFVMSFIAINAWVPTLLEQFENYPILTAGTTMLPRGIASFVSMVLGATILRNMSSRLSIVLGVVFFAMGCYMFCHYNTHVDQHFFLIANLLQGLSSGLFFVPISKLAYQDINLKDRDMAAGLFNFARTLGSSTGIAVFSNFVSTETQVRWHALSAKLTPTNPNFKQWLVAHHFTAQSPGMPPVLAQQLHTQASMYGYRDAFFMAMVLMLGLLPLLLCFKPSKTASQDIALH